MWSNIEDKNIAEFFYLIFYCSIIENFWNFIYGQPMVKKLQNSAILLSSMYNSSSAKRFLKLHTLQLLLIVIHDNHREKYNKNRIERIAECVKL